ncbi:hypothetical protein HBI70_052150 [Parastagonospora nodorum]|nr:hypothetical protein HBH53_017690 [Parastagonospora nodorum]KAH4196382.1 hypothetical protein HBI95_191610 [Parastagonospora nodorum]KAH5285303.1 hypothetical protein HBI70_052150 [Parastagonospora nodorum]KAH5449032.1 hypothetical protein HBI30_159760 [Parastagonospora nodorum]KAH5511369.1 hypothetical protein HBI31_030610 [Parastagonospora nodorum]
MGTFLFTMAFLSRPEAHRSCNQSGTPQADGTWYMRQSYHPYVDTVPEGLGSWILDLGEPRGGVAYSEGR